MLLRKNDDCQETAEPDEPDIFVNRFLPVCIKVLIITKRLCSTNFIIE